MQKLVIVVMIAGLICGSSTAVRAEPPVKQVSPVFDFNNWLLVPGATAKVWRKSASLKFDVTSYDFEPGHAVTLWLLVFNHPENCTFVTQFGPCSGFDLFNLAAGGSQMWAGDGRVVNEDGMVKLRGLVRVGEPPGEVFSGPGLTHPQKAFIVLIARDHGPYSGDAVQLTTFDGGCDINACTEPQGAFFIAP